MYTGAPSERTHVAVQDSNFFEASELFQADTPSQPVQEKPSCLQTLTHPLGSTQLNTTTANTAKLANVALPISLTPKQGLATQEIIPTLPKKHATKTLGQTITSLFTSCFSTGIEEEIAGLQKKIQAAKEKNVLEPLWQELAARKPDLFFEVAENLSGELITVLHSVKGNREGLSGAVEGLFRESAKESDLQNELKRRLLAKGLITKIWEVEKDDVVLLGALLKRVCGYLPTERTTGSDFQYSKLLFQLRAIFKLVEELGSWSELKGKFLDKAGFAKAAPTIYGLLPSEHRKSKRLSATPITVSTPRIPSVQDPTPPAQLQKEEFTVDELTDLMSLRLKMRPDIQQNIKLVESMTPQTVEVLLQSLNSAHQELEVEACYKRIGIANPKKMNTIAAELAEEVIDVLQHVLEQNLHLSGNLFKYKERVIQSQLLNRVLNKPVQRFAAGTPHYNELMKPLNIQEECQLMLTLFCRICSYIPHDEVSQEVMKGAYDIFTLLFEITKKDEASQGSSKSSIALAAGKAYSFYTGYATTLQQTQTKSLIA